MRIKFDITVFESNRKLAFIGGRDNMLFLGLTIGEVADKIPETEQFLERLTGLRYHIEMVKVDQPTLPPAEGYECTKFTL